MPFHAKGGYLNLMHRFLSLFLSLILLPGLLFAAPAFDYILLISTAREMTDAPGESAFLPQAKQEIADLTANILPGSYVFVYTFDQRIVGPENTLIRNAADHARLVQMIRSLPASGNENHLWSALDKAVRDYEAFTDALSDNQPHVATFLVWSAGPDHGSFERPQETLAHFLDEKYQYSLIFCTRPGCLPPEITRLAAATRQIHWYSTGPTTPVLIELRAATLEFGNLAASSPPSTTLELNILNPKRIARGTRISWTVNCPDLPKGITVRSEPLVQHLSQNLALRLKIDGGVPPPGSYPLTLTPLTGEAGCVYIPGHLHGDFDVGPEQVLTFNSGPKETLAAEAFTSGRTSYKRCVWRIVGNEAARSLHGNFHAEVILSSGNPAPIPAAAFKMDRNSNPWTESDGSATELMLSIATQNLPPGQYYGEVLLTSHEATLRGQQSQTNDGNRLSLPFTFEVRPLGVPAWFKLLIGMILAFASLLLIALALRLFVGVSLVDWVDQHLGRLTWRDGELVLTDPPGARARLSLRGRQSLTLGQQGDWLQDAEGMIRLIPSLLPSGRIGIHYAVLRKPAFARVPGDSVPAEEMGLLYDGDILVIGRYSIVLLSGKLTRP